MKKLCKTQKFLSFTLLAGLAWPALTEASERHFALPDWAEWQQVLQQGQGRWAVDIDNDSLLLKKDDGLYTSGYRLQRSYNWIQDQQQTTYRWYLGQDLYTPSDIKWRPAAIPKNERPYAGWLYLGMQREHYESSGRSFKIGLELGCMGPCAGGEWSQTKLHQAIHQALPQGWSTQVGRTWGAQLHIEASPGDYAPWSDVSFTPSVKMRAGTIFTDVAAAMLWRYGKRLPLPDQAGSYWFARAEARLVGKNASIEKSRLQPDLQAQSKVGEVEAGYFWQGQDYGLSASVIRRSSELEAMPNSIGAQNFVRLQLQYRH